MSWHVKNAPLAQLDRASGYGPEGQGFEFSAARQQPRLITQIERGCSMYISKPLRLLSLLHIQGVFSKAHMKFYEGS